MKRALIVDDTDVTRMVIARLANDTFAGRFTIDEASSFLTAVKLIESEAKYGLILLDLDLGGGPDDGIHLLEHVNKHQPGAKVIVVSASAKLPRVQNLRRQFPKIIYIMDTDHLLNSPYLQETIQGLIDDERNPPPF
ncbi:MAG: response regulator, partial [Nitrospinae bacterium]|nr:response regulator [Nitrospinota bacterium]